jgi:hypothetical protein
MEELKISQIKSYQIKFYPKMIEKFVQTFKANTTTNKQNGGGRKCFTADLE